MRGEGRGHRVKDGRKQRKRKGSQRGGEKRGEEGGGERGEEEGREGNKAKPITATSGRTSDTHAQGKQRPHREPTSPAWTCF